jgi:hypothetical protein
MIMHNWGIIIVCDIKTAAIAPRTFSQTGGQKLDPVGFRIFSWTPLVAGVNRSETIVP